MFGSYRRTVSSDFDTIFWYYNTFLLASSSCLLLYSLAWAVADQYLGLVELEEKLNYTNLPNWMLFVAGIGLISAFCGYFYVLTKTKIFYLTNVVLMVISSTAEFKNYKEILQFEKRISADVTLDFRKQVRWYFRDGKLEALNEIQEEFKCCGWRGSEDYNEDSIPGTCCKNHTESNTCKLEDTYPISCSVKITEYFTVFFKFAVILYQMHIIIDIGCLFITTLVYHLLFKKRSHPFKKR